MSDVYIILISTLSNIGGAQLYINNKIKYLKNNGWKIYIFQSKNVGEILVEDLKNENVYTMNHFDRPPIYFTKNVRNKIINNAVDKLSISENDRIIIESDNLYTAQWAEFIAQKIKAKSFVYLLGENFGNANETILNFLDFKHKRKELAGTSKETLELIFKNYKTLNDEERYNLVPVAGETFQNLSYPVIDEIRKHDINLCCISRLQKPFIKTMIDEIVRFSLINKDQRIQLILIGDSPHESDKVYILEKTKKLKNLNVILVGKLYPLPLSLLEKVDLFIGVAGAIKSTAKKNRLSLSIDVNTHKPIGLLGIDAYNTRYGQSNKYIDIFTALQDVLIDRKLHEEEFSISNNISSSNFKEDFDKHMLFISESESEQKYYTDGLLNYKYSTIDIIQKLVLCLVGPINYRRILSMIRNNNFFRKFIRKSNSLISRSKK